MKKILILLLSILFTSCFYWGSEGHDGCDDCGSNFQPTSTYEPIILKRTELDASIEIKAPQEIVNSSKIYIFEDFIFITDKYKGFHIFDNSDPKIPTKKKFLKVPGATDISIRDNILYINQATDLITLSFNKVDYSIKLEKRIKSVLTPHKFSPDRHRFSSKDGEVIVDWKLKK